MGTLSIGMVNNLLWLGRYTERVFTTLSMFLKYYDQMLESPEMYKTYVNDFGLDDIYDDRKDFIARYLYDESLDFSLISTMYQAFDNAVILRDQITSDTLCYIQMALTTFSQSQAHSSPVFSLLPAKDYIYAFWGSIDDCVDDEQARDIIRIGRYIERIDMYTRLDMDQAKIIVEFQRLSRRMDRMQEREQIFSQFFYDKLTDLIMTKTQYSKPEVIQCLSQLTEQQ